MPVKVIAIPRKIAQTTAKQPAVRATPQVASAAGRAILVPSSATTGAVAADPVASFSRLLQGLDYLSISGVFMGAAMILIGFSRASESKRSQKLEIAGEVAPALIGAATGNPIVGAASSVAIKEAQGKAKPRDYGKLAGRYAKSRRKKKKEG